MIKEQNYSTDVKKSRKQTMKIISIAILSVMIVGLAFLPINVGALSITLTIIPIAVGAILYGPAVGASLGLVFGLVSFTQCFGYSPFGLQLLSINWFFTFLVCVPTRVLVGFIPGIIHKAIAKTKLNNHVNDAMASILVPLLNTFFFMTTLILCFYHTELIQNDVSRLGASNAFVYVILSVGINGLVELLVGAFITFPVVKTLRFALNK